MSFSHDIFSSIDKRRVALVISLDSGVLRASALYFQRNQPPTLLAQTSLDCIVPQGSSRADIIGASIDLLPQLCHDISLKLHTLFAVKDILADHQQIHRVIISFSSPWVTTNITQHEQQFDTPTIVNQQTINQLMTDDIPQGMIRLDNYIASVHANGYAVEIRDIINKPLRTIELLNIHMYANFADVETVFQIISTEFNLGHDQFRAIPELSATLAGIQQLYRPQRDFIISHIHALYTDIVIFKNSRIVRCLQIPFGYRIVVDDIIQSGLALSAAQAESLINTYARGHLNGAKTQTIHTIMSRSFDSFAEHLDHAIDSDWINNFHDWFIIHDYHFSDGIIMGMKEYFNNHRIIPVTPQNTLVTYHQDSSNSPSISIELLTHWLEHGDSVAVVQ